MKVLPFPNKTIDPLNITIFADIVLFGYLKFHISKIVERKLPEEFKNPLNTYYMSEKPLRIFLMLIIKIVVNILTSNWPIWSI